MEEEMRRALERDMIEGLEANGYVVIPPLKLTAGKRYVCDHALCMRADHITFKEGNIYLCEKDGVLDGWVIRDAGRYFRELEDKEIKLSKFEDRLCEILYYAMHNPVDNDNTLKFDAKKLAPELISLAQEELRPEFQKEVDRVFNDGCAFGKAGALKARAEEITHHLIDEKIGGIQHDLIEFLSNAISADWRDIQRAADSYTNRIRNFVIKSAGCVGREKLHEEFERGRKSAYLDLPRWRKRPDMPSVVGGIAFHYVGNIFSICRGEYYIPFDDLCKLEKE